MRVRKPEKQSKDMKDVKSMRVVKSLISSTNAGERLGRHCVNGLVFGDSKGVLVANQSLGVQLE